MNIVHVPGYSAYHSIFFFETYVYVNILVYLASKGKKYATCFFSFFPIHTNTHKKYKQIMFIHHCTHFFGEGVFVFVAVTTMLLQVATMKIFEDNGDWWNDDCIFSVKTPSEPFIRWCSQLAFSSFFCIFFESTGDFFSEVSCISVLLEGLFQLKKYFSLFRRKTHFSSGIFWFCSLVFHFYPSRFTRQNDSKIWAAVGSALRTFFSLDKKEKNV